MKKIKGGYYLYGVKGAYNPVTKKSRKVSLGIIGRITETGGLVKSPKGILRDGIKAAISKVLDKEYGFSLFLFQHIKTSILPALRTHFPDDWVLIVLGLASLA